ncbi:MAG: 5-methyltetrahydropteroyltriglutamate--homocysteine S-methyltransferase [Sulfurihydrogenibium azorense]|uniref:5-methyltetrahydropteroyltriglutamate-- homocysteine S-methyltransferase n=1 Tax=Sulfurihydrogenibium azorense TaxID=309806 RepID=UPI00391D771A
MKTTVYGYPKIGENRELKKVVESYWKGEITKSQLLEKAQEINLNRVKKVLEAGIDIVPSNDFSLYDFVLDTATMFNVIPERFKKIEDSLDLYFAMARGSDDAIACEMTKWFDTNYHYIVPELAGDIKLVKNRPLESYKNIKENLSLETKPVIIGPFTFVYLSKVYQKQEGSILMEMVKAPESEKFEYFLDYFADLYNQVLRQLQDEGVKVVQLDEPAFVLDLSDKEVDLALRTYQKAVEGIDKLDVIVQTYYESLSSYEKLINLPVKGIGLDFVSNTENFENIKRYGFPKDKLLVAGVVSGRDPWKTDLKQAAEFIKSLFDYIPQENIILSNASPLFHLPVSLKPEVGHLSEDLINLLSFADERLEELKLLKQHFTEGIDLPDQNLQNIRDRYKNEEVRKLVSFYKNQEVGRKTPFKERYKKQMDILKLPLFPTTTIGSFPQTQEVRKVRADYKAGRITEKEYKEFIKSQIANVIKLQEELDLDVLVHGEFERTDMVEFFGEKLEGFTFTKNGWVQSYGTRCVRPPIIYGDVSRPNPMTLEEITYAQSLTNRPVKGMLTGPVTILNWSFYRKDIPKEDIAYQIALALRQEVIDLEKAGIKIIQIDEPAFREGLPLKKSKQEHYLNWSVNAFKLSHDTVKDETQIHTHMCYSEFNEIIEYIYKMDADVISIEASRSKGEILGAFEKFNYDHGIGIGVYDIHSPRVPREEEIEEIVRRALRYIDKNLIWINPDCGLKTRGWDETVKSLKNMVNVAKKLREELK